MNRNQVQKHSQGLVSCLAAICNAGNSFFAHPGKTEQLKFLVRQLGQKLLDLSKDLDLFTLKFFTSREAAWS